jgi:hypothetical protein
MASWDPRELVQWFEAPRPEDEVQALHQDRVHLDPLGEGQLGAQAIAGEDGAPAGARTDTFSEVSVRISRAAACPA